MLAAYKKLQDLGTENPTVWAIEPFAINLLNQNINGTSIVSKQWILRVKNGENKNVHQITTGENANTAILCDKAKCGKTECTDAKCNNAAPNEVLNMTDFENNKFHIVLGDLPFVSANTNGATNEQMAYYDLHHDTHRALLRLFNTSGWVEKNAILITAFSTLGGYEDTSSFAQMIQEEGLINVQYFCYLEADYHWIIYCLMKKTDFEEANKNGKDYWKDRFGIQKG